MQRKPEVTVLALGGTIAMADDDGVLKPSIDGASLVAAVPAAAEVADISARTVATLPSASLMFDDVLNVHEAALAAIAGGADGVVVTQGTDTLEEVAFLLDLWWPRSAPLVVTGAMRGATQPGADGPANLLDSVVVAADAEAAAYGCVVVMAGEIHAARYVRKTHSRALNAFASPSLGPVGLVIEQQPRLQFHLPVHPPLPPPLPGAGDRIKIAIVESVLGDDGSQLDLFAEAGYDAIVLAACGVGHVSSGVADRVERLAPDMPIVLASRTGAGSVSTHTYGFAGSEKDLLAKGAISAGILDARKARLLLWALMYSDRDRTSIDTTFSRRART